MDANTLERTRLLSPAEVAAILGCSPRTVARQSSDGRLPKPLKIGKLVRYPANTLRRLLDAAAL